MKALLLALLLVPVPLFPVGRAPVAGPWVKLSWDNSPDPTVVSYNLYWGDSPGSYTNSITAWTNAAIVRGLQYDSTYYFAVTAYSTFSTLESDPSSPVSVTLGDPPTNLWVTVTMLCSTNLGGPFTVLGNPLVLTNPPQDQMYFKLSITKTNF